MGITCLSTYKGAYKEVEIHCSLCDNSYTVVPHNLLKTGCTKCEGRRHKRDIADVKKEIELESRGKYKVISTTYKNSHEPITIEHIECGTKYPVSRANFMYRGRRCPNCASSIGEKTVKEVLMDLGVKFYEQQKFEDLVYKSKLSYDFYLPDLDILIEYQGKQHYKPIKFFGGEDAFETQLILDNLKREYAKNNSMQLVEIPYTIRKYEDIKNLLVGILNKETD